MKQIFLFAALLLSLGATAQRKRISFGDESRFKIKASPLSIVDYRGANLPVGVEYTFAKKWSTTLEGSVPFLKVPVFFNASNNDRLESDIRVRAEIRKYSGEPQKTRTFMGVEAIYRQQQLTLENTSYVSDAGSYGAEFSEISKTGVYAHCILGIEQRISNRMSFELFGGLGAKWVSVDRENDNIYYRGRYQGSQLFVSEKQLTGSHILPSVAFGFKMAYYLNKHK